MSLSQAIREVSQRHAERIAVPGQWKVWREGDRVKAEIMKGAR